MKRSERVSVLGMLLASALVLAFIEQLLPPVTIVPGIRYGLANIPVVFSLYFLGRRSAVTLASAKTVFSCLLFGGMSVFIYSAAGTAASVAVMLVLSVRKNTGPAGVSAAGGAAHVSAQLGVAMLLTGTAALWRLLPLLIFFGTVSGTLTGLLVCLTLSRLSGLPASGIMKKEEEEFWTEKQK